MANGVVLSPLVSDFFAVIFLEDFWRIYVKALDGVFAEYVLTCATRHTYIRIRRHVGAMTVFVR